MLQSLHISNYALIDRIDIEFGPGLNIITGETGAGKSIMLSALGLLLGGRADLKVIRDRNHKSVIEASFTVDGYITLKQLFAENDIEWDDQICLLRRELAPSGRTRAFINDSPITLTQLRAVAMMLVDLHSQHQNLLLATPEYQLSIIDSLANNQERLNIYEGLYNDYKNAVARYRRQRRLIEQSLEDEEFTRFQLSQLEEMNLVAGEQEELENERDLLTNIEQVKSTLATIINALDGEDGDALSLIRTATDQAQSLTSTIAESKHLAERLDTLRIELQDIADTFSDYDSNINADPTRLIAVEDRLNDIYALQRKHHVDSVEALIAIRDNLREKLMTITHGDQQLHELETAAKHAKHRAMEAAREISKVRIDEATRFADALRERAIPLGMKNLVVEIRVEQCEMTRTGIDKVEFLFAFNKNQTPLPVGDTASGGEISRLMLCIKSLVASKMQLPSLIFDEVDTGVSGDVANRMGQMMLDMAGNMQVIAITHLPQVAAKGTTHFKVYKEDDETSTNTRIRCLTETERIDELALMLSGDMHDEAARAAAKSLLSIK